MRVRWALLLGGYVSLVGCAGILGFEDFMTGPAPPDAGEASVRPTGPGEEAKADFYVSEQGDDNNDGSIDRPLKTVVRDAARAAEAVKTKRPDERVGIAICVGTYISDAFAITGGIDVFGDYDCATWRRPPSTDGPPGRSQLPNTRLQAASPAEAFLTLAPALGRAPRLDRLQVTADDVTTVINAVGETVLTELDVQNTTKPSATNGRTQTIGISITGQVAADGGTAADGGRTDADGGGAPKIEHCQVFVSQLLTGSGETQVGNGMSFVSSRHLVRKNHIAVTAIKGTCEGIIIGQDSAFTVTENDVVTESCVSQWGAPPAPQPGKLAIVGVGIYNSEITSVRNSFRFEKPGASAGAPRVTVVGMVTRSSKPVMSDGDRIVGPTVLQPGTTPAPVAFRGFEDEFAALARVVNASIVLNSRNYILDNGSAGIKFIDPTKAVLAHNSMYFTRNQENGGFVPMRGVVLTDRSLEGGASELTIASNLVVSDDPRMAFVFASCNVKGIKALTHNRHAGFDFPAAGPGVQDCTTATLDQLATTTTDGNVALSCPDAGPDAGGCATLFESIDPTEAAKNGLRPNSTTCVSVAVPSAGVTVDGSGKPRGDAGTTAGAFECN